LIGPPWYNTGSVSFYDVFWFLGLSGKLELFIMREELNSVDSPSIALEFDNFLLKSRKRLLCSSLYFCSSDILSLRMVISP